MASASVRLGRQCLETDRLLGVDAVLVRPISSARMACNSATDCDGRSASVEVVEPGIGGSLQVDIRRSHEGGDSKAAALEALRVRHDRECPHCTIATAHTRTVFGEGNPDAALLFVGEAPGETEDQLGRPFVGKAGQKLDEMIRALGLAREDVYIANVLKSRPPGNRTPLQDEVDKCGPYLMEQIRIIDPRVIVTLGGPATKLLLRTELGITRLRGVWAELDLGGRSVPVMPTFHPAYLLRNYTLETRRQVWSDLQAAKGRLTESHRPPMSPASA